MPGVAQALSHKRGMYSETPEPDAPSEKPEKIEQFVETLIRMMRNRVIYDRDDGQYYTVDVNLPFKIDEDYISLTDILRDPHVQSQMQFELDSVWRDVVEQNPDIGDKALIYDIFTLKMVGIAIEAYLKNRTGDH